MNDFLKIINTLKDIASNLKIDKEQSIGIYNHNGNEIITNVSIIPTYDDYIDGCFYIDNVLYNFNLPIKVSVSYYCSCKIDYYPKYEICKVFPNVAEIILPNNFGIDYNYWFDIKNDKITLSEFEYEDLNFEPINENLNDWDDDYMFYLKLQGII